MRNDTNTPIAAETLPAPPAPAGRYEPVVIHGGIGLVSGQLPIAGGRIVYCGRVGLELTEAEGRAAARVAARNVLAQIGRALGGFERLDSLLRVDGYVASAPGFLDQPGVLDAASEVFVEYLGARGRHTRTAVSVPQLPLGASVELAVTFAVRPQAPPAPVDPAGAA